MNSVVENRGTDELGSWISFLVDSSIYDKVTILKTCYWFTNNYYVWVDKQESLFRVIFRPKGEDSLNAKEISGSFNNSLVDNSIRKLVADETQGEREVLLKKAFFEANRHQRLPQCAVSEEGHLPAGKDSYLSDPKHIGG